jgi:hypothetical protein
MHRIYLKISIALVFLFVCNNPLKAQDNRNNGFVGIGLGPSFLSGNNHVKAGTGLNLTLLNAGYVWEKGFGITGVWTGGAHIFDTEATVNHHGTTSTLPAQVEMSYGALMIGPMYTLYLSANSSLDLKARVGSLYTREKSTSEVSAYESEKFTISTSLGVGYRQKIANHWSLMLSSDYYAGRQQYTITSSQNTHIFSFTTGVGFVW